MGIFNLFKRKGPSKENAGKVFDAAEIIGEPSEFDLQSIRFGTQYEVVMGIRCGGCGKEWKDAFSLDKETNVVCPFCGGTNRATVSSPAEEPTSRQVPELTQKRPGEKIRSAKGNVDLLAQVKVDSVKACCFLPDDETLAVGLENGEIQLLDSPNYSLRNSFLIECEKITQITCSDDNNHLAVLDRASKSIWIWALDTGEKILSMKGIMEIPNCIALSPECDRLAVGNSYNPTIHLYDLSTRELIVELQGHGQSVVSAPLEHAVNDLDFSPDGRLLVSVGDDARAILWDLETNTGECLMNHKYVINQVRFNHGGDWFATGGTESYLSEGAKTLVGLREVGTTGIDIFAVGDTAPVNFLAYIRQDTKVVAVCSDEKAWLWSGEPEASCIDHDFGDVLALSPEATKVAGVVDDTLKVWSIEKLVQ